MIQANDKGSRRGRSAIVQVGAPTEGELRAKKNALFEHVSDIGNGRPCLCVIASLIKKRLQNFMDSWTDASCLQTCKRTVSEHSRSHPLLLSS